MTPRIHAAKKAILEQLENENLVSIIEQAHDAYEKFNSRGRFWLGATIHYPLG
ncbi:hypothetical protein AAHB52_30105 [Bacillus toyonensis]